MDELCETVIVCVTKVRYQLCRVMLRAPHAGPACRRKLNSKECCASAKEQNLVAVDAHVE
jgi:hypothetical protein